MGDVPAVNCTARFSDVVITGVGPNVFAAEIVGDFNTGLVEVSTTEKNKLCQSCCIKI